VYARVPTPWTTPKSQTANPVRAYSAFYWQEDEDYFPPSLRKWLRGRKFHFLRWEGGGTSNPFNAYVTEDGTVFYVAEDGSTFYVQET
jgi:hypothetical protein